MSFQLQNNNITLDLSRHKSVTIHVSQYDRASRPINITVTDNGKIYPISQTSTVRYQVHKPDGTFVDNFATVNEDGTVSFTPNEQVSSVPGILDASIQIFEGENVISPLAFQILVHEAVIKTTDVESAVEVGILDKIISYFPVIEDSRTHMSNEENPHHVTASQVGLGNVTNESKATMFTSPVFTGAPTAPTPLAGTNTEQIATTSFVQTAVSNGIAASDALIFKGSLGENGTVTVLPTVYRTGWTYRVITPGIYAGETCEMGDLVVALVDRNGTENEDSDWCVTQTNIDGAITQMKSTNDYLKISQSGGTATLQIEENDMAPTYTEASSLSALTTGEKLSAAFGKIATAINTFISHISTRAGNNTFGHVKVASNYYGNGVQITNDGYLYIQQATTDNYGIIKTCDIYTKSDADDTTVPTQMALYQAYTDLKNRQPLFVGPAAPANDSGYLLWINTTDHTMKYRTDTSSTDWLDVASKWT